jgi:K+ transporter
MTWRGREKRIFAPSAAFLSESNRIYQTHKTMRTQITIDTIFAVLFFALFVAALVGIFGGAWWHIGTAAISYTIFAALRKEIKQCRAED